MASLTVVSGQSKGDLFPLTERTVVVGRGASADIRLVDEMVSRHHMEIRFDAETGCYQVKDLKSANGVFINGEQISADAELEHHDMILVGESKLCFSIRDDDTETTVLR